jgi:glycosyltransferase involved in cell wall biosynthesis
MKILICLPDKKNFTQSCCALLDYVIICFLCIVKVVILHQHFNTPKRGGPLRSYYLAKALADNGIETIIITAHGEREARTEIIDGIEVHYLPVAYNNAFGFYRRVHSFLKFMIGAVQAMRMFRDADLCYAISVPLTVGVAAMRIKSKYKIPFVFEVGDLWPDAPVQLGFIKNHLLKSLLFRIEKSIYNNATAIVALSEPIQKAVLEKTINKNVTVLTNIADTEFFYPREKPTAVEAKLNVSGKLVVSYIGTVGFANGLDYFLECARASQRASLPVYFLLCGDGASLNSLKRHAEQLKLGNVTFIPFLDRHGVREIMSVTDVNFISYRPVAILETGCPHKYFDGLAGGKVSIVNFRGWIKDEIEMHGCGFFVDPFKSSDFVNVVSDMFAKPDKVELMKQSARKLAENKYSRQLLTKRFYHFISTLLALRKQGVNENL